MDSVLVADVPVQMCEPYKAAADKFGIDSIFIAPPNGDAGDAQGCGRAGLRLHLSGEPRRRDRCRDKAGMPVEGLINTLREFNAPRPARLWHQRTGSGT